MCFQRNITDTKVGMVKKKTSQIVKNATEVEQIVNELFTEIRGV